MSQYQSSSMGPRTDGAAVGAVMADPGPRLVGADAAGGASLGAVVPQGPGIAHPAAVVFGKLVGPVPGARRQGGAPRSRPWVRAGLALLIAGAAGCVSVPVDESGRIDTEALGYEAMLQGCQAVLVLKPRDYYGLLCVAEAQHGMGNYVQARANYQKALEIKPQETALQLKVARTWMDQQDYAQARSALQSYLAQDPNSAQGWRYLGMVEAKLGSCDAATAAYGRALVIDPADRFTRSLLDSSKLGRCAEDARRELAAAAAASRKGPTRRLSVKAPRTVQHSRGPAKRRSVAPPPVIRPVSAPPGTPPGAETLRTDAGRFKDHPETPVPD